MDILDHPEAQALLHDAELTPAAVRTCAAQLTAFAQRYLPHFQRAEQRDHALTLLQGKLTGLQRKTTEPIATAARQKRRPCNSSWAPAAGRTGPSATNSAATWPRNSPTPKALSSWMAPASPSR